jgi:hypothetical protein
VHLAIEQVGDERRAALAPEVPFRLFGRLRRTLGYGRKRRAGFAGFFENEVWVFGQRSSPFLEPVSVSGLSVFDALFWVALF